MWWAIGFGGILYIILAVTLGLTTLRKGHGWMFVLGFPFPVMWIIGAFSQPTESATT